MSLVDSDPPSDEVNLVGVVEDGQVQMGCHVVKVGSEHLYEGSGSLGRLPT